jgi:hypothetical protein
MRAIIERLGAGLLILSAAALAAEDGSGDGRPRESDAPVFRSSVGEMKAGETEPEPGPAEAPAATAPVPAAEEKAAALSPLFVDLDLSYAADPPPPPPGPPGPGMAGPYTRYPVGQVGVYLGGYFQPYVLPEEDTDFIDPDVGWGFTVGYAPPEIVDFLGSIGMEFAFEFSDHEDKTDGEEADYKRLLVGFKVADTTHDDIQPYFTFGASFHDIEYKHIDYEIDGAGGYFGGGIDFYVDPVVSIGIDVKLHFWSGEDSDLDPGDGFTPTVSIMVLFHL